jgi:N-acetylmuramoyl-L-alanine amidase
MASGQDMLRLARTRVGDAYRNVCVPKNNPNWTGPWDCAEFASWLVYQLGGFLYGCIDNAGNPATTEAYTGAWQDNSRDLGRRIDWQDAAAVPGAVLLRFPPAPGGMGHIVISDGRGGTVEAMGSNWGVTEGKVTGRHWDTGVLIPGFDYDAANSGIAVDGAALLYRIGAPNMRADVVRAIQRAVLAAGYDPGPVNGVYGHNTAVAVGAFQAVRGLVIDGQVGPDTAAKLGVDLSPNT